MGRCRILRSPESVKKLACGILSPLLHKFTTVLDDTLPFVPLEPPSADWARFLSMVNSALYLKEKLMELQSDELFAFLDSRSREELLSTKDLSLHIQGWLDRCAKECIATFVRACAPFKAEYIPGRLASRITDTAKLAISPEICTSITELRHILVRNRARAVLVCAVAAFARVLPCLRMKRACACVCVCVALQGVVSSRLARHTFVSVLFQCAKGVAEYLESIQTLIATPTEFMWLDSMQFRHDVNAVLQVFSSLAGQAHWVVVKSAFIP